MKRLITASIMLIAGLVIEHTANIFWIHFPIFLLAYLLCGWEVLVEAGKNLLKLQFADEYFLMAVATIGAFAIGEYAEGLGVMVFWQVGELLQEHAVGKSRAAITSVLDIRPDFANVKGKGKLSPDAVEIGEVLIIKAGEKIPLDGVVLSGESSVDTSTLTGESLPRDVVAGDMVNAGTINVNGLLEITVTAKFSESAVAKILELCENAEEKKSKAESFITKFAKIYTPVVMIAAVIIAVIVPLIGGLPFDEWIHKGLMFLVISCPCALVVSVPLGYFAGIGSLAKLGVLVKGSVYFEPLANVGAVAFDKTGTLTEGRFTVASNTDSELLKLAAQAEYYSNHPIAKAIVYACKCEIDVDHIADYTEIAGMGVSVTVNGDVILAGNNRLLATHDENPISHPVIAETHVLIAKNSKYVGAIILSDEIKPTAKLTITKLNSQGIETVMLTGDNKEKADIVAKELALTTAKSELMPAEKSAYVEELRSRHANVVFVGDGINDAPSLITADVGIAMGSGADIAIEAADIVIMGQDPSKLLSATDIAKYTRSIVTQNVVFAIAVKLAIQVLAILSITNMWVAVFADVGVALLAVANSLRIMGRSTRG